VVVTAWLAVRVIRRFRSSALAAVQRSDVHDGGRGESSAPRQAAILAYLE